MTIRWKSLTLGGALLLSGLTGGAPAAAQPALREYKTPYYRLYTDLDDNGVREARLRITLMAEEYFRRTSDFARNVNQVQPFYLFSKVSDYRAAGGPPNTAGVFDGRKLMAVVQPNRMMNTWRTVQHEGFHQFAVHAIGRGLPIWANEGLAEYFGYGVWTGDNFFVGLVPQRELVAVQTAIERKRFKPLRDMMLLPHEVWNAHVALAPGEGGLNYLQAWSMIHFLAHADGGKYQKPFGRFLGQVSGGAAWEEAWRRNFGANVADFQRAWETYWISLPPDPTRALTARATLATLTSFFARAFSQRQMFENIEDFFAAARAGDLKAHREDWLPPSLLSDALQAAPALGEWRVERRPGSWQLLLETKDGPAFEGRFRIKNQRVDLVEVLDARPRRR